MSGNPSVGGYPVSGNPPHPAPFTLSGWLGNTIVGNSGLGDYSPQTNYSGELFCSKCDCLLRYGGPLIQVVHSGVNHLLVQCFSCAGYGSVNQSFTARRVEWIIEGSPFVSGTPRTIVADWLEEQGKYEAADFMRGTTSGG